MLKQRKPLQRKTPMSRGTSTLRARPPDPSKPPKPKRCKNRGCEGTYIPDPRQAFKCWCSDDCAVAIATAKVEKQKAAQAKKLRAEVKAEKDKRKTLNDWIAEAQVAFNAYIRERDRDKPCICCGSFKASGSRGLVGGGWDAGHYITRGHAPHLRFVEANVHKQRKGCNRPGGTTRAKYRLGLIDRIGLPAVLELEAREYEPTGPGFTVDEMRDLIATYRAKLRALQKAAPPAIA